MFFERVPITFFLIIVICELLASITKTEQHDLSKTEDSSYEPMNTEDNLETTYGKVLFASIVSSFHFPMI